MMYLLSLTCCTPSRRMSNRSAHSSLAGDNASGVRINTGMALEYGEHLAQVIRL